MDYIRSVHNKSVALEDAFIDVLTRRPARSEIVGWHLFDIDDNSLIKLGELDGESIEVPICFLSHSLNFKGDCLAKLVLFVSIDDLIKEIMNINSTVILCYDCPGFPLFDGDRDYGGLFLPSSKILLPIEVDGNIDGRYIIVSMILLACLIYMHISNRSRVRKTFRTHIIEPIESLWDGPRSEESLNNKTVLEILDIQLTHKTLRTKSIAVEMQNRVLANEIHDMYGGLLLSLKWDIEKLPLDREEINRVLIYVDQLMNLTNDFIDKLRPEVLDTLGLSEAIKSLAKDWLNRNIGCKYKVSVDNIDDDLIPEAISVSIYRIVQESLINIYKHSKANSVYVDVKLDSVEKRFSNLIIRITDNGIGFDYEKKRNRCGLGLISMSDKHDHLVVLLI